MKRPKYCCAYNIKMKDGFPNSYDVHDIISIYLTTYGWCTVEKVYDLIQNDLIIYVGDREGPILLAKPYKENKFIESEYFINNKDALFTLKKASIF